MSYLVEQHKSATDPFLSGDSAVQLGLMMNLTRGFMFPWREGGTALLRRELYPDVHEWEYCGLAIGADTQITNYPGFGHSANQAYQYAAVSFLGNGMISAMGEPVRLDFDGGGALISPGLPNFPINAVAEPLPAGKFKVTWEYETFGQRAAPKDFQVFEGPDPPGVDYNAPLTDSITGLTSVKYIGRRRVYSFTTGAYADMSSHVFAVRARNAGDVAEKNSYTTTSKRARVTAPAAAAAAEREFRRFYAQARSLKEKVGELTPELRAESDLAFWCVQLKRRAAIETLLNGRPNVNTLECILSLPAASRKDLLGAIRDRKGLLDWLEEYEPLEIKPDARELAETDVRALCGPPVLEAPK